MDISHDTQSGALIVTARGRLDSASAPELERALAPLPGDARVVLDLAQITYISSAGIGVLIGLLKRLGAGSGRLALCALTPQVRQVLNIAGLESAFDIQPSVQSAALRVTAP